MKKSWLFLVGLILFMPLTSAQFLGLDDFYLEEMIENDWLRFALIFLLIFAFIFYSLKKFFKNDRKIAGFISIILSLMISSFIFRTGFLLDFVGEEMVELVSTIAILALLTFFILTMLKKFGCKGIAISLIFSWFVVKMFNPEDYYLGDKFSLFYDVFTSEVTLGAFFIMLLICFLRHHKPQIPSEFSGRLRSRIPGQNPISDRNFEPDSRRHPSPEETEKTVKDEGGKGWNKKLIKNALANISANTGISMREVIRAYKMIVRRDSIGRKPGNERKIIIQVNNLAQDMRKQQEGQNLLPGKTNPDEETEKTVKDEGRKKKKKESRPASFELYVGAKKFPEGTTIKTIDLTKINYSTFVIRNGGKGGILSWRAAASNGLSLSEKVGKLRAGESIEISVKVLERKLWKERKHVTIMAKRGRESKKEGVRSLVKRRIAKSKIYYQV